MTKFVKKPIVVEATQWFKDGDHERVFLCMSHGDNRGKYVVNTMEGVMQVTIGDWIITGTAGEVYPVKPDIFTKIYDPVRNDVCPFI